MPLSEKQLDQIKNHLRLNTALSSRGCPVCSAEQFYVAADLRRAPTNDTPSENTPSDGTPSKDASTNDISSEDAPSNTVSTNVLPTNTIPTNGTSTEGATEGDLKGASPKGAPTEGASSGSSKGPGDGRPSAWYVEVTCRHCHHSLFFNAALVLDVQRGDR